MSDLNSGHSDGEHYLAFRVGKEIVEVRGSDPELETFAIVGNTTADFNGMGDITATYDGDGFALIDFWASEFPRGENGQDYRERFTSRDVTLTANFSNLTISGRIDNFTSEAGNSVRVFMTVSSTRFDNQWFDVKLPPDKWKKKTNNTARRIKMRKKLCQTLTQTD